MGNDVINYVYGINMFESNTEDKKTQKKQMNEFLSIVGSNTIQYLDQDGSFYETKLTGKDKCEKVKVEKLAQDIQNRHF